MRFLYTLSHLVFIIMVLFQLYLETVQDLLAPGRDNITIVEDPKTGDVSFPGVTNGPSSISVVFGDCVRSTCTWKR